MFHEDTIAAIATAVGEGSIGIVRVSGVKALEIAERVFRPRGRKRIQDISSHSAVYGNVFDPVSGDILDEALLLIMKGPHSYTREDVVEFQCHGGPQPLHAVLSLVLRSGARLAEPGEFTKRAFLNGRLDLSQAEAVMDLIRAKTDATLRVAVGQLGGSISGRIREFRSELLRLIAHLEVSIDYPEEDIEELAAREVLDSICNMDRMIDELIRTGRTGRILRDGLKTAIIGRPNVGKSSLLNALLGEDRAIVTDIPGTTRDVIEEVISVGGIPLRISDTAGIRDTEDIVERIGVDRARLALQDAELILFVLDASMPMTEDDRLVAADLAGRPAIFLVNKSDLSEKLDMTEVQRFAGECPVIRISALDGSGVSELNGVITRMVYEGRAVQAEGVVVTNARHLELLRLSKDRLCDAMRTAEAGLPPDCIVVDLRSAWEILGQVLGDTVGEDLIDQIFSQFCLGK